MSLADSDMMSAANGAIGSLAPNPTGIYGLAVAYTGGALYAAHDPSCGYSYPNQTCKHNEGYQFGDGCDCDEFGNAGVDRTLWPLNGMPKPGIIWDQMVVFTPANYEEGVVFDREPWSLKICGCCTLDTNSKLWALDARFYQPYQTITDSKLCPYNPGEKLQGFLWGFEDCLAKKGPALITQSGALIGCDPVSGRAAEINLCWEQLCVANGYDLEIAKDEAFTLRVVDLISAVSCSYYRPVDVLKPCVFFPAGGSVVNIALTTNLVAAGTMLTDAGGGLHVTTITTYDNVTGEFTTITDVDGGFGSYAEGEYGVEQDQNLNIGPAGSAIALAGQLECGHKYFWRVQARNCATGVNLRSQWSEIRSFSVKAGLPIRADTYGIKALAPDNGAIGIPVKPVAFSWAPMGETTKYKFVLAKDAAMTQVVAEAEVPTTSYAYNGTLDYSTNYFWRVMAIEPSPTDWSATFAFQTEPAPQPPPAPEEAPGTPMWVWVIIAIGAILVIVTLVLIFKTRRA